ncbi:Di-copper centre-containing protein [Colletotrichum somersetense]|nr:Di-copper centre-containing protein [Colletotrichum somersetense]
MFSSIANGKYRFLSSSDPELSNSDTPSDDNLYTASSTEQRWRRAGRRFGVSLALLALLSATFELGRHLGYENASAINQHLQAQSCNLNGDASPSSSPPKSDSSASSQHGRCTDPYFRKEWRMLSRQEKLDYIKAVKCLASTPSIITGDGTIHDDFAFVHNMHAHSTHDKAAFLPWHRRFISVYETYLKDKCSYAGALPYWDWTLDWENFLESPIFSSVTGFGGNGQTSAHQSVGEGHCVTDGPFADLQPLYYGPDIKPHCLSRGFTDFPGRNASPEIVQNSLGEKDYETFLVAVETGPHNMAPNGLRGEFYHFTAPNDPVFYLHHAQLDRLWFIWQRRDERLRLTEYSGKNESATLDDLLHMEGLEEDVSVSQVMDTQGGGLCYQYSLT